MSRVPPAAVNAFFVTGGPQLGQFRSGFVADFMGAPLSGASGGLAAILCAAAIALVPAVRGVRALPDAPATRAA